MFGIGDWALFRNKIWCDLEYTGFSEYYSAIFDSRYIQGATIFLQSKIYMCSPEYRMANQQINPEFIVQNLKLVYSWGDMSVLDDVFKKIDCLFNGLNTGLVT